MIRFLSFVSGIPALIYQVVWTREVGLLVGGQMVFLHEVERHRIGAGRRQSTPRRQRPVRHIARAQTGRIFGGVPKIPRGPVHALLAGAFQGTYDAVQLVAHREHDRGFELVLLGA